MKTVRVVLAVLMIVSVSTLVRADRESRANHFRATLIGFEEVPSVSTPARGRFAASFDRDMQTLNYTLRFDDLNGTVNQSHIHFAQPGVNGGIVIWLCQTAGTPAPSSAGNVPTCVEGEKIEGTVVAANVQAIGNLAQGIAAGDLDEVLAAMRSGYAYANVHALPNNGGGEIRGQIQARDRHDRD